MTIEIFNSLTIHASCKRFALFADHNFCNHYRSYVDIGKIFKPNFIEDITLSFNGFLKQSFFLSSIAVWVNNTKRFPCYLTRFKYFGLPIRCLRCTGRSIVYKIIERNFQNVARWNKCFTLLVYSVIWHFCLFWQVISLKEQNRVSY